MKASRLLPLLLVPAGAVLFLRAAADPPRLVRVEKSDLRILAAFERLQIDVALELAGSYLVRANREDLAGLRRAGLAFSVLSPGRPGASYAVIRSGAAPPAGLPPGVKAVPVETGVYAVWEETGRPLELPPGLAAKPLPAFSILPYLKRPNPVVAFSPAAVRREGVIDLIVNAVDVSALLASVRNLQGLGTRYASTPACEAAGDLIFQYFQALGLRTSFEPFTFRSTYASRNVVAEKRGTVEPGEIVIICGHYDSYSNAAATLAPGADDNASGTAAVMEAARLLAPHAFDFTVRFIAFSAEEWGLYGSAYHASRALSSGERIVAVINLDMIAYADASPEDLELIVNADSGWLADRLRRAASTYTSQATRKIVNASLTYSDHSPFWDRGYAAVLAIEDEPLNNPCYHRTSDTVETLDPAFFTASTRTALAALSELGQPVSAGRPRTPSGLTARVEAYSSLFTSVRNVRLSWTASAGAAGFNIYRSGVSRLGYQKLNAAPLSRTDYSDDLLRTDQSYYYAVTAVAPDGGESNFSRQAEVPAASAASELGSIR
jgi:hypothetical protein